MIIHTASEGISLSRNMENDSAVFYEKLAQQYGGDAEVFLAFAKENKKNVVQIERAYYGVITDAIEGGYALNLETDKYTLNTAVPDGADYSDVLKQALEVENSIIQYYTDAAEQSKSLLADVPRAFTLVAKKRKSRLDKLSSLL
jgi:rubrerythrin